MNKGFTIVESLVAIAILVAAVIGASSAIARGLSSYLFSKDEVTAFYLAQEGFEELRAIRDENALNSRSWLTGIALNSSDPCYFGSACTVSPVESSVATRCSAPGSCPALREDSVTGFFGYNAAWPASIFTREVKVASVNADEIAVTVTLTWAKGGAGRTFKARENLFRWQ